MNIKAIFKYLIKRGYNFYNQGLASPQYICLLCKKDNPNYLHMLKCFPYSKKLSILQFMKYYKDKVIIFKSSTYPWHYIRKFLILSGCNCTFNISIKASPLIIESIDKDIVFLIAPIVREFLINNAKGETVKYTTTKVGFKSTTGCTCSALIEKQKEEKYNPERDYEPLKHLQIKYLRHS